MSIKRAQREINSKEFLEHVAYYRMYGRSSNNLELQIAGQSLMFYNANRGKAKAKDSVNDFMVTMPLYDRLVNGTKEQQQADKMHQTMMQFTQAFNVSEKNKNKSFKERR
jgi:hypothetical protein